MKTFAACRNVLAFGIVTLAVCLCTSRAQPQDPNLKATFGSVTLKAGFLPDPFAKKLIAGGPIKTNLGGVAAWVAKPPDFKLHYTAGKFPLTIHVVSDEDTTLLINLPDGTWVANDDQAPGNLNPLLRFAKPQSGRYDIYVGTFKQGITPPATLYITELK
jgi:hypothetical protein